MAVVYRLKRKVRVLTAQKRRLGWDLRVAQTSPCQPPQPTRHHQPAE